MKRLLIISLLGFGLGIPAQAADHLNTAVEAGGLTAPEFDGDPSASQPFLNGFNNTAPTGEAVPGQGSPLTDEEHTVPASDVAVDEHSHATKTPPPVDEGKTAPSQ